MLLEALIVASLVTMVLVGSAQAEAEGLNETAFWAFVTIAVTVVVSVFITGVFHYLSTRELRKMGVAVSKGVSGDIKTGGEQIQKRIAENGEQTRKSIAESGEGAIKVIEENGEETRKVIIELAKSYPPHHSGDCEVVEK